MADPTNITSLSTSAPTSTAAVGFEPDSLINHAEAISYWQGIDADVNGMLGGFPYISRVDLQGSRNFLAKIGVIERRGAVRAGLRSEVSNAEDAAKVHRVVDCGAGYVFLQLPSLFLFFSGFFGPTILRFPCLLSRRDDWRTAIS